MILTMVVALKWSPEVVVVIVVVVFVVVFVVDVVK